MDTWCALGAVVARRRELGARPLHVDRRRVVQVPHVAALHVDVEVRTGTQDRARGSRRLFLGITDDVLLYVVYRLGSSRVVCVARARSFRRSVCQLAAIPNMWCDGCL